jgi:hypothetical protein
MPEETIDENGNVSAGGSFKWCDGVLLKAIKNRDWVLLQLSVYIPSHATPESLSSGKKCTKTKSLHHQTHGGYLRHR